MKNKLKTSLLLLGLTQILMANAQSNKNILEISEKTIGIVLFIFTVLPLVVLILYLFAKFKRKLQEQKIRQTTNLSEKYNEYIANLSQNQIKNYMKLKNKPCCTCGGACKKNKILLTIFLLIFVQHFSFAATNSTNDSIFNKPGIIITIILFAIPILLGVIFALIKANNSLKIYFNKSKLQEVNELVDYLKEKNDPELENQLLLRNKALSFKLLNNELAGDSIPIDNKGIITNISNKFEVHFTAVKKKAVPRPNIDPATRKLILWYIGIAAFWLLVGTFIGEYVGIKFISPEIDSTSWLSFGRIRPVHTNIVFWGWASLGMIGLGYYVVPMVSNTKIYSVKWGWIALVLTNIMIISGSICLMNGINNGGGEFREYIWPVMAFFAVALILTILNFILTVAKRTTKEIYISNWYILSSFIFTIIVALTAYLPFWQDGVSETIVQGYFMHSGVGMWFTLQILGLLYYFIPQQLNQPIYAYSLGILAFWTQIIFYTIIGTHHFIFAPIPWWLQTVGIVGSAGMIIPVVAASINYFMTFKGNWRKVTNSYTLPFFLVAVIYYLIVSLQGTAEAFQFSNLIWHFTDFTVAHAHLGFYGIVTFAIWGGIYVIVPRLTGKEPAHSFVGAHFWIAFIGLIIYAVPLSIGATIRGLMWMEGKPFIDSVVAMFEYWLWRAIGGSLMFISHIIFAYNFYQMVKKDVVEIDVKETAFNQLNK